MKCFLGKTVFEKTFFPKPLSQKLLGDALAAENSHNIAHGS
jgi:hypothetical protein